MIQGLSGLTEYLEPPIYSWVTAFATWTKQGSFINGELCPIPATKGQYCECPKIYSPEEKSFAERLKVFLNVSIDSTCCQHAGYVALAHMRRQAATV